MALPVTLSSLIVLKHPGPPPFKIGSNYYIVSGSANAGGEVAVLKATDPTGSWAELDGPNRPHNNDSFTHIAAVVDGTDIHIATMRGSSASSGYVDYHLFDTVEGDWVGGNSIKDESVVSGIGNSLNGSIEIGVRSDGDVLIAYNGAEQSVMGTGYSRTYIARRESGSWTVDIVVSGGNDKEAKDDRLTGAIMADQTNDRFHVTFQIFQDLDVFVSTYRSDNSFHASGQDILIDDTVAGNFHQLHANIVSFSDSGTKIRAIYADSDSDLNVAGWDDADVPSPSTVQDGVNDSSNIGNSGGSTLAVDGTTQHALFRQTDDSTIIHHDETGAGDDTWGTDTDELDTGSTMVVYAANVYDQSGTVLAYLYTEGGTEKYNERVLAAGGSTTNQAVAVTHTITITDVSIAAIRIFAGAISHAAAIAIVKGIGLPRVVAHTAAITQTKKIGVFKAIAHAIAASTVVTAIRNFTSDIAHAVGITTVRAKFFLLVSNIAHSLAASTTLSTTRILISNIAHGLAAFLIKKISVSKAVTHTVGGTSTRLVRLLAKAVAHVVTATSAIVSIRSFVSNVAHSTSVTSAKFVRLIAKAVTHSVAVALVKTIKLPRAVAHAIAASTVVVAIRNFTSAITHTATITTAKANFFSFVSNVSHSLAVSTLASALRFFVSAVSHAVAATLVKRIRFTKTVVIATAATSVKLVKLLAKAVAHVVAITTVRANFFTIVSDVAHTIAASTSSIITRIFTSAVSHATTVALVKKIGLVKAVAHATAATSVKLVKPVAKAISHAISVTMTTANKFLIGSSVTHTATMSLVKTIKMAKAIGHAVATASTKVVKISKSIGHSVAVGAEQVATLLSVSSVTHTIGVVTGSVLSAAHSVAVGISHVASLATLFIDGGGGGPVIDKLHRRLRAWRKMFN